MDILGQVNACRRARGSLAAYRPAWQMVPAALSFVSAEAVKSREKQRKIAKNLENVLPKKGKVLYTIPINFVAKV